MTGLELKEKREALGLSQKELAFLIGVGKNTVYNYESGGKIPDSKIPILKKVLDPNIGAVKKEEIRSNTPQSIEDIIAEKVMLQINEVVKKILESHQRIIKELGEQSLDIDDLQEDVKELKDLTEKTYNKITHG